MRITLLALLLFPATADGQAIDPARAHELAQDLLVPIHTQPDDPDGGAYGIWAAGPSYKVSFHDGFAFYPDLGPTAPRHLPLQWHTESATVGNVDLLVEAPSESYAGQRFERRSGDLIEAYEVRRDGVEQTFTLLAPPSARGALTIAGRITTPLSAPITDPRHGELVFTDEGRPVVRYGSAVAIDAAGRSWPLDSSYDGERIRLCVPPEIVATASYPLLVDPLTSATALNTGSNFLGLPAIAASTDPANPRLVVAWTRNPTASDFDVYAMVMDFGFQSGTWIYQDVTTSWSTPVVDVAHVANGPAWVLALQRDLTATKVVRAYVHDYRSTTLNGGTTLFVSQPSGVEQLRPAIGGSMGLTAALLVFDRYDPAAQLNFSWGVLVSVATVSLGTSFRFDAGLLVQTHSPSVTPTQFGSTGWVVGLSSGSEVWVARVPAGPTSVVRAEHLVTPGLVNGVSGTRVAGCDGRFLLTCRAWACLVACSAQVRSIRFDWPASASLPSVIRQRILASTSTGGVSLGGCDFDVVTRSHWAVAFEDNDVHTIARCGYSGGITESHTLPGPIDVSFARPSYEGTFPIAYAQISISGISIRGRELQYPSGAISSVYGTSCAPGAITSSNRSYAGHEFYRVSLRGIPAGAPAIYALSGLPDALDLGAIGLFGCYLNVLLPAITFTTSADPSGTASVSYPLPDDPPFIGDLYSQWFFIDAGQAQPVRAAHGTRHQVR